VVASAPTVGSNYERYEWKGVNFGLIDIGGQTSLRSSWSQYFVGTSAIILVIDSSDAGRLPLAKAELDKLTQAEVRPVHVINPSADEIGTEIIIITGVGE
jgi:GTPase SAR1 family protein